MKIAVINAGDKTNPHEMFTNPSDASFENFLTCMDIDINDKSIFNHHLLYSFFITITCISVFFLSSFFSLILLDANKNKQWNHVNITYFVATQLNKDEHRRY